MNVLKLKGTIVEKGYNVTELAEKIGKDRSTLYRKLSGDVSFSLAEVQAIKNALDLTREEASAIFFD